MSDPPIPFPSQQDPTPLFTIRQNNKRMVFKVTSARVYDKSKLGNNGILKPEVDLAAMFMENRRLLPGCEDFVDGAYYLRHIHMGSGGGKAAWRDLMNGKARAMLCVVLGML